MGSAGGRRSENSNALNLPASSDEALAAAFWSTGVSIWGSDAAHTASAVTSPLAIVLTLFSDNSRTGNATHDGRPVFASPGCVTGRRLRSRHPEASSKSFQRFASCDETTNATSVSTCPTGWYPQTPGSIACQRPENDLRLTLVTRPPRRAGKGHGATPRRAARQNDGERFSSKVCFARVSDKSQLYFPNPKTVWPYETDTFPFTSPNSSISPVMASIPTNFKYESRSSKKKRRAKLKA